MTTASLTLVGSGIKFYSHLTHECKSYINQSDLVLYLVNDPAMKLWIKNNSKNSESLDDIYVQHTDRLKCYHAITSYILKCVKDNQHVCVVLYGHPCVYSMPGLNAIIQAEREGFNTCILPGISAEDCLFADLKIDPSTIGCQSFEATDYLIHRRKLDTTCHVIFWQIDAIGVLDHSTQKNKVGLELFVKSLTQHYAPHHEAIIYEAAQHPGFKPRITRICLQEIFEVSLTKISTLYVPPTHQAIPDQEILKKLNINI